MVKNLDDVDFTSHFLAHELKMLVSEVDKMSIQEYYGWLEYFKEINKADINTVTSSSNEEDVLNFLRSKKG